MISAIARATSTPSQVSSEAAQPTFRAFVVSRPGGPEVMVPTTLPLSELKPRELLVRVNAAGVGATDLMMIAGRYRFAPPMPLVPGYEIAGAIERVGVNVDAFKVGDRVACLTVHGGFAEYVIRGQEHFVRIPDEVTDHQAAAATLNYVTAWQMVHRVAASQPTESALVTGAAGGVGTALLDILRHAGVTTFGVARANKHDTVRRLGAIPVDSSRGRIDTLVRALRPGGVDYVFDALGGRNVGPCLGALRRGGLFIGFGFMAAPSALVTARMFFDIFVGSRVRGRRGTFFGVTERYRQNPAPFREDLAEIFQLVGAGSLGPLVSARLPLWHAPKALELLAGNEIHGKIVLIN